MSLQFNPIAIFLVVLIFLGVIGNNSSITIAATVLLLMQQTFLAKYLPYMEKYGLNLGIIILTVGVLAPIISGKIQLPGIIELENVIGNCNRYLCRVVWWAWRRLARNPTGINYGVVDWHHYRSVVFRRHSCWAVNCGGYLILNVGKKLIKKREFSRFFYIFISNFINYLPSHALIALLRIFSLFCTSPLK